jgi:hypothetical protein
MSQTRTTLYNVNAAYWRLRDTLRDNGLLNHPVHGEIQLTYTEGRPRWGQSFSVTYTRQLTDAEVAAITDANGAVDRNGYYTYSWKRGPVPLGTAPSFVYWTKVPAAEVHPDLVPTIDLTPSRGEAYRLLTAAREKVASVSKAKTDGALEALNTVAGLLLDNVGLVTYETMVADGMERTEALRTAILLGRMEG